MLTVISALLTSLFSIWRTRAALQLEILALRHQIGVLQRGSRTRPRLRPPVVGVAVTGGGRLVPVTEDRQAGDGPRLAPEGLPVILDAEGTPRPGRKTQPFTGG